MQFKRQIIYLFFISTSISVGQINLDNKKNTELKYHNYIQKSDSCKVNFDYDNSFKYISKLLSIAKENKDRNTEILCTIKFVELYRHARLYQKAEFYLKKAEDLIKKQKNVTNYNLMYFYNRKAALFSEFYHIPDSTLLYSKKALVLSEKLKNVNFQFTSLMEIGYFYEQINEFSNAINYYQKAFQLAKINKKKSECCDALVNTARVFEKKEDFKKAIEKCDEGLKILENNDNFFQKLLFHEIKQKSFEKLGDNKAALYNLKMRLKFTDLYYEKNAQYKLLKQSKKNDEYERNLQDLKRKNEIDEVKNNQLLLMVVVLLFVLGLISLLYYSKKLKIANKKLDFFSKENAFLLNEVNHRINNNLQLIIVLLNEELDKVEETNSVNLSIKKILVKVESISTLHRHLYRSADKKTVDINEYLNEIVNNFNDIFEEKGINVNHCFTKINVSIDLAMYLGLLATELFINSIKYAFNIQENKIISLKVYEKESVLYFDYCDNGKEIIGKEIIPNLAITICKQIKADCKIETKLGFEMYVAKNLTN